MTSISALPSEVVSWLNDQEYLSEIKFMTEYPPEYKAVPLRRPIVSVGVNKITISDHFTANDNGVLERDEYCRTADIELLLSIHVPFSNGGSKCHEVFTNVVDCLTFSSDLNITNSHCDRISSDRDTEALVMNAYINVQSDFCPSEEAEDNFHSFLDKELLCGSHIRDDVIHITEQEREKWSNMFHSGTYVGTGADERTVNLGFRPAYLHIFTLNTFPAVNSTSDSTMIYYTAYALGTFYSKGIETTNTGFKVYNNSRASNSSGVLRLNEAGVTYCFIAFKPLETT